MVYPVNNIMFKIGTAGSISQEKDMQTVSGMETFSISIDNGIEEWNPMESRGWTHRLLTSKSLTIGLSGKRVQNDPGNDYVARLAFSDANGLAGASKLDVEFPNGDKLSMDCVINVTACGGGDSTSIGVLEFECLSNGKPTFTESEL